MNNKLGITDNISTFSINLIIPFLTNSIKIYLLFLDMNINDSFNLYNFSICKYNVLVDTDKPNESSEEISNNKKDITNTLKEERKNRRKEKINSESKEIVTKSLLNSAYLQRKLKATTNNWIKNGKALVYSSSDENGKYLKVISKTNKSTPGIKCKKLISIKPGTVYTINIKAKKSGNCRVYPYITDINDKILLWTNYNYNYEDIYLLKENIPPSMHNYYDGDFLKTSSDIYNKLINKEIKIVAVIATFGRGILVKYTIRRLYNKNKLYKVICVGEERDIKEISIQENAEWVEHTNYPLGKKWNAGFQHAKKYNPDAMIFVGSSDWISENWIPNAYDFLSTDNYGIVGKRDFYMYDLTNSKERTCHWLGYPIDDERRHETIGIGRLISRSLLEKIDYKPFDDEQHNSLDWIMYQKCLNNNFKVLCLDNKFGMFLSLSCDLWSNKHFFEGHYLVIMQDYKNLLEFSGGDLYTFKIYKNTVKIPNEELKMFNLNFIEVNDFYRDYLQLRK